MGFLIEMFWAPLLIAAVLGIWIGWITCRENSSLWPVQWIPIAAVAFIIGVVAALQLSLPGRWGLWLETGLLMFSAYVIGCYVGCAVRALTIGSGRTTKATAINPGTVIEAAASSRLAAFVRAEKVSHVADGSAPTGVLAVATEQSKVPEIRKSPPVVVSDANAAATVGAKPPLLSSPRDGGKDDLSLIWGVAEKLEARMNRMGIWHFDQIAGWSPDHIKWFEYEIEGFKGRLERDKWVEQCKKLASGWRPEGSISQRPIG